MDEDLAPGDAPATGPPLEIVGVGRRDEQGDILGVGAVAVHVAHAPRPVAVDLHDEVGRPVMGFPPGRPDVLFHGPPDFLLAFEGPERRSDLPDGVVVPDTQEPFDVVLVATVAVLGDESVQLELALQAVDPRLQVKCPGLCRHWSTSSCGFRPWLVTPGGG